VIREGKQDRVVLLDVALIPSAERGVSRTNLMYPTFGVIDVTFARYTVFVVHARTCARA